MYSTPIKIQDSWRWPQTVRKSTYYVFIVADCWIPGVKAYVVKSGDELRFIARDVGQGSGRDFMKLAEWNHLYVSFIKAGAR
jgi:hypothetical protein